MTHDFSKATPRPWTAVKTPFNEGLTILAQPSPVLRGFTSHVAFVGDKNTEQIEANSALIVEAVNSYDANRALIAELVEALRSCPPTSDPAVLAQEHLRRIVVWWSNYARPALDKAKEAME